MALRWQVKTRSASYMYMYIKKLASHPQKPCLRKCSPVVFYLASSRARCGVPRISPSPSRCLPHLSPSPSRCSSHLPELVAVFTTPLPVPIALFSQPKMIRVRWERNGCTRYDGRTQDIPLELVVGENQEREVGVGDSVRVEWQDGGRLWNAVVLEKRPKPSALDLALPPQRVQAPTSVSFTCCAL